MLICTGKEGNLMLKVTMLATLIAGIAMGTNIAANTRVAPLAERDAEIIVEVDRSNKALTEEGIHNTQQIVMNNIRKYVTSNFEVISEYSEVANAFAISVNSEIIEQIKKVPGVKSVTRNQIHWVTEPQSYSGSGTVSRDHSEYGGTTNISAVTMNKSNDTNDGEGTVIAVLDNEFFFRAEHTDEKTQATVASWNHETFSPLADTVKLRYAKGHPESWKVTHAYKQTKINGKQLDNDADMGKEGSLYFNNKVPFYYDYGGERPNYSVKYNEDNDVSSELSYHGSHVASIATGNAPDYKGIAPKAQLVCMKVFTNTIPTTIGKLLGNSGSSGAYDIPIMNALDDCMKLKVDGINMSLGSNLNDFDGDSITVKTLNKLAESGILTSISAGNSGKTSYKNIGGYANWTEDVVETGILSGYSNQAAATTVASGQPTQVFYEAAFQMENGKIVAYDDQIVNREGSGDDYDEEFRLAEKLAEKYPDMHGHYPWVYVPGFGTATDYKGIQSEGKIVVVNRGSTSFADKYATAKGKGAIALVVINNDPTSNDFNFRMSFGDGFRPTMPCVIVLHKDKGEFADGDKEGYVDIISKRLVDNDKAYSVSTFSSDGATFDLDLKPEITAPGDLIKGAVPPQKKEDRGEDRRYEVYEFLSGTSMSAPNYAGAQSVVLSKYAKTYVERVAEVNASSTMTDKEKEAALATALATYQAARKTVDMRLASTANPMLDPVENELDTEPKSLTSPRRQGAGMVNLGAAYSTKVYLEGSSTGKTKINLRNNEKINKGIVDLSFTAYNEDTVAHEYKVKLTVMRPKIVEANEIITKEYNYRGEADTITALPGYTYFIKHAIPGNPPTEYHTFGVAEHNDVYNVTKDIEYYASAEDCINGVKTIIERNRYYNAGTKEEPNWQPLPSKEYQSTIDETLAVVDLPNVTVAPGKSTIKLQEFRLSDQQKADIASFFDYGTYIEGFVSLEDVDTTCPTLGIPFMGFYAGEGKDYGDAPIYEPFSFEKDDSKVYPSDLANDIAKSLLGKDKANLGSMILAGYVKEGTNIDTDAVWANDNNFANLSGFYELGLDPETNEYPEDAADNLYCGSAYYSNTLIIQQYTLRSCLNNYFTLTSKTTGEVVYKSALSDSLFGADDFGRNTLYKSHVDDNMLGGGYVAHRAYAIIPLYDENGHPFASDDYELTFNFLLSATGDWKSSSYTLHLDSDAPEVSSITEEGDNLRINIKEKNLKSLAIDKDIMDISENNASFVKVDEENYYYEISKEQVISYLKARMNKYQYSGRLVIKMKDAARGKMGVIVRFETDEVVDIDDYPEPNWENYVLVEHHAIDLPNDFEDDGVNIKVVRYDSSTQTETEVALEGYVLISRGPVAYTVTLTVNGCGGNIATTSILLSTLSLIAIAGIGLSLFNRKKVLGGND